MAEAFKMYLSRGNTLGWASQIEWNLSAYARWFQNELVTRSVVGELVARGHRRQGVTTFQDSLVEGIMV